MNWSVSMKKVLSCLVLGAFFSAGVFAETEENGVVYVNAPKALVPYHYELSANVNGDFRPLINGEINPSESLVISLSPDPELRIEVKSTGPALTELVVCATFTEKYYTSVASNAEALEARVCREASITVGKNLIFSVDKFSLNFDFTQPTK